MPTIEHWSITTVQISPYIAPEGRVPRLQGLVNGQWVITSPIVSASEQGVQTKNTLYTLGKVDPAYEVEYPNARQRLMRNQ